MSDQVSKSADARRRVQVWFGSHVIAELIAGPAAADRYAAAMDRRFCGLRITNDPIPGGDRTEDQESPVW